MKACVRDFIDGRDPSISCALMPLGEILSRIGGPRSFGEGAGFEKRNT